MYDCVRMLLFALRNVIDNSSNDERLHMLFGGFVLATTCMHAHEPSCGQPSEYRTFLWVSFFMADDFSWLFCRCMPMSTWSLGCVVSHGVC